MYADDVFFAEMFLHYSYTLPVTSLDALNYILYKLLTATLHDVRMPYNWLKNSGDHIYY